MLSILRKLKKQKLTYSKEMKNQDSLWKEEKEDITTMKSLFTQIISEANEMGFRGTTVIYHWDNEALIDVLINNEVKTFGYCQPLIEYLETVINQ